MVGISNADSSLIAVASEELGGRLSSVQNELSISVPRASPRPHFVTSSVSPFSLTSHLVAWPGRPASAFGTRC